MANERPRAAVCSNNICDNSPDVVPDRLSNKQYWGKQVTGYLPDKPRQQSINVISPDVDFQDNILEVQQHTSSPSTPILATNYDDIQNRHINHVITMSNEKEKRTTQAQTILCSRKQGLFRQNKNKNKMETRELQTS